MTLEPHKFYALKIWHDPEYEEDHLIRGKEFISFLDHYSHQKIAIYDRIVSGYTDYLNACKSKTGWVVIRSC